MNQVFLAARQWFIDAIVDRFADWFFAHSSTSILARAALGALVKELGGSVVLSIDQLHDADAQRIEIVPNEDPEGMRIFIVETL